MMKRKRGSKSKERDRNKMDDVKSHKHSRRKRKSSDSESDDNSTEVTVEQVEDSKNRPPSVKKTDELENNASNTRITRHSKRLAAISASSDELKEEGTEVISSPVKTGKLSPYSISSPSKECKVKNCVIFYLLSYRRPLIEIAFSFNLCCLINGIVCLKSSI